MTTNDEDEAPERNRRAWPSARNRAGGLLASLLGVVLILLAGTDAWAKGAVPVRETSAPRAESIGHFASGGASETDGAPSSPTSSTTLKDTYAAREVSAKNLEKFRGGDVVIISSTTVLVVLLVVLIIVVAA